MKNKTLLISIIFTIIAIINAAVFLTLGLLKIVPADALSYALAFIIIPVIWIPFFAEKILKFKFNLAVLIFYEVFICLGILGGSGWELYSYDFYYDKIIHTASGVLFALIFYNLFANYNKEYNKLFWIFVITFSFSMMIGGFWEICEFTSDAIMDGNAQKYAGFSERAALMDTMGDIICDFVGSIIGAAIAVILHKNKSPNKKDSNVKTKQTKKESV